MGEDEEGRARAEGRGQLAHKELVRLADELLVPKQALEDSVRLCAAVVDRGLGRRMLPTVIAASALYAVCRERQVPVTLKEFAEVSALDASEIGRCYRLIVSTMGLAPPSVDASLFAFKVAERAHVSDAAANLSSVIVRRAVEAGLGGRNPMSLAAAGVYVACLMIGEVKTQADIAEAASVGEASVRECAKAIRILSIVPEAGNRVADK